MNRFFATGAGDVKRLKGGAEFRLRSGDYRVRFSIRQDTIRVLRVLHRSEAYRLARISHRLTVEARDSPAITSLHLLAVLTVLSKYASARQAARASY